MHYNFFYSQRDSAGDEKKKLNLRKNLERGHFKKDQADPDTKEQDAEVTAICLNCPTCHVKEENNSLMQFSQCRTKQNNKTPRLWSISAGFYSLKYTGRWWIHTAEGHSLQDRKQILPSQSGRKSSSTWDSLTDRKTTKYTRKLDFFYAKTSEVCQQEMAFLRKSPFLYSVPSQTSVSSTWSFKDLCTLLNITIPQLPINIWI